MSAPAAQRQRVEAGASGTSTNEHYAKKHGVPDEVNDAIPGVAMRIRQAMGQGSNRAFGRTESSPAVFGGGIGSTSSSSTASTGIYLTDAEAQARAWAAIQQETLRVRELGPYASNESVGSDGAGAEGRLNLSPRRAAGRTGSPDGLHGGRKLRFGQDGEVELVETSGQIGSSRPSAFAAIGAMAPGKKRGAEGEPGAEDNDNDGGEGAFSDTATEVDEDEDMGMNPSGGPGLDSGSTINDDFPSVFNSPAISQPELFGRGSSSSSTMGPPAVPLHRTLPMGRTTRSLPVRKLGKTVSAPVMFGQWGMDVDMTQGQQHPHGDAIAEEDGFSVSEWSKEEF